MTYTKEQLIELWFAMCESPKVKKVAAVQASELHIWLRFYKGEKEIFEMYCVKDKMIAGFNQRHTITKEEFIAMEKASETIFEGPTLKQLMRMLK